MNYETFEYKVKNHVAWVTFDRVANGNTLNDKMSEELMDIAWRCEADDHVRAVVITGNGKSFSFGGDLKSFVQNEEGVAKHIKDVTVSLHEAISRFVNMEKPIITAVNGFAAGAGMSLAIIGDIVVAADDAKFTLAYTNVGLTPDGSISYFLPRIVGLNRALELAITNRVLTANEAEEWGLVTRVVESDQLMEEVEQLTKQIVSGPVGAYGQAKVLLNNSYDHSLETQMVKESALIAKRSITEEAKEGIQAFLEKREAKYL